MVDGSALPSMESSALSSCCKAWAEVDLESMRSKLDDTGLKIADAQEQALQNRRKLAEATRDFKRSTGDTPVKGLGPLLKQYQEEIDRLTQRCKSSESAFLEVRATAQHPGHARRALEFTHTGTRQKPATQYMLESSAFDRKVP